jgi:hypothetical protein
MTEPSTPGIGAAASLNLAAALTGPPMLSGVGTLTLGTLPRVTGSISGTVGITASVSGTVGIIATGDVVATGPATAAWDFLSGLPPMQLMELYAFLQTNMVVALQDPEHLMYSVLFTLPFLALVLRAINQRRQ